MKKINKSEVEQIARFLISGGIGVGIYYAILYSFTKFIGTWYLLSSFIAAFVLVFVNFYLQKYWTFKNKDKQNIKKQVSLFVGTRILFFLANTLFLYILVDVAGIYYMYAQLISSAILAVVSYVLTKRIFFPRKVPPS